MKKKSLVLVTSLFLLAGVAGSALAFNTVLKKGGIVSANIDNNYWYHYAKVEPTKQTHGSKEFWANCATLTYSLVNPGGGEDIREGVDFSTTTYFDELTAEDDRYIAPLGYTITFDSRGGSSVSSIHGLYGDSIAAPSKPKYDGHHFAGWSYDAAGSNKVSWPITLTQDWTLYANWNERIDLKPYLQSIKDSFSHNPYSYIPEELTPNGVAKAEASEVNYDFSSFTNVSSIKYGGFGEQWNMVIDNIEESERFYKVLNLSELVIDSSIVAFNNWLDSDPDDLASHTLDETEYTAKLAYASNVLSYSIQLKSGVTIPLFGEVIPQIDASYNILTGEKSVRIQVGENNALKYVITKDSYTFGIEYGVTTVSRKAYFTISKDEHDDVEGHIYEYVQFKDKDLVPACADFYIGETYTSVVGNKANAIAGFAGFINELYLTAQGKLLGYKVKESFTKWGFNATYHTLWFNLNNITGITNVKAIDNGGVDPHENNHDIYLNNSETVFTPTKNKKLGVKTSRKYDVEMRTQFFYGVESEQVVEYERSIPMMFIQDDHDDYTNYSDFVHDIQTDCGINASVNLSNTYLTKIRNDYETLIPLFEVNKGNMPSASIVEFIGSAEVI